HRERMSDHPALELATLALGQTAPDPEALVVLEGVFEALGPHLAGDAHLLGLTGGAALLREERLRIGLRAQRALLPGQLGLVGVLPGDVEQGQLCTRVVVDTVLVHRHRSFHCCVDHRCVDHRRLVGPKVHRCSYGPSSGVGASPCTSRPSPRPSCPTQRPRRPPCPLPHHLRRPPLTRPGRRPPAWPCSPSPASARSARALTWPACWRRRWRPSHRRTATCCACPPRSSPRHRGCASRPSSATGPSRTSRCARSPAGCTPAW